LYTNEQEIQDFLTELQRSKVVIETTVRAVLNRAVEFEHKFRKPFYEFTTEEALEMYESAHAISVVSLQNMNLLLKNASRWFAYKHCKTFDSVYENITKDILLTVIDVEKQKSMMLSREDIDGIIGQLLNYTDRCLIFLMFHGVSGYMLDELTFMKWGQVSHSDLKIYFKNGKTIDITEEEYQMLKKGFEEDELISFGSTARVAKVRSAGLYKVRANSLSDNDNPKDPRDAERRYRWAQRRLQLINKDLGYNLTSGALNNSGLLWHLQQKVKEMGMSFREFTKTNEALEIARKYGILSEFFSQILWEKFSQYFKED
jgi:hypothetical protein